MSEHDLLDVVEIEKISGLSPWGWDAYYKELQSTDSIMLVARDSVSPNNAEDSGRVIGFIVARLLASELHINNVAVRPEHRRFGAGANLVDAALNWARNKRSDRAVLEVRAGNRAAQALYRRVALCREFTFPITINLNRMLIRDETVAGGQFLHATENGV